MSLEPFSRRLLPTGFPRVSGDEPVGQGAVDAVESFSPRERG